jgi:hypothetical protein
MEAVKLKIKIPERSRQLDDPDGQECYRHSPRVEGPRQSPIADSHRHAPTVDSLKLALLQLEPKVSQIRAALRAPASLALQLPTPYRSVQHRLQAVPPIRRTPSQMLALYAGGQPPHTAALSTQRAVQAPEEQNEAQTLGRFFLDALATLQVRDRQLMRRYTDIVERCDVVDTFMLDCPHADPAAHRRCLLSVFVGLQKELEQDLGRLQAAMQDTESCRELFAYTEDDQIVVEGDALVAVYLATPMPLSLENIFPGNRRVVTVTNYQEYCLTVRAYSRYVDTLVRLQCANQRVREAVRATSQALAATLN